MIKLLALRVNPDEATKRLHDEVFGCFMKFEDDFLGLLKAYLSIICAVFYFLQPPDNEDMSGKNRSYYSVAKQLICFSLLFSHLLVPLEIVENKFKIDR